MSCCFAVIAGCLARFGFEETHKVLRIFKAKLVAYLCNGQGVVGEQLHGGAQQAVVNKVLGRAARFGLDQLSKVLWRVATLVGKVSHGRQTLLVGLVGYVVVEHGDKLLDGGMVNLLACDELPVVKAQTVVEQQFDVAHNKLARVLVDAALQLLVNHVEHASEYVYFGRRQVQGFVRRVVKELVTADVTPQLCTVEQVGVEHYGRPFGHFNLGIGLYMY